MKKSENIFCGVVYLTCMNAKKGTLVWMPFLLKPMLCYEARPMLSTTRRAHIQQRVKFTQIH